MPAKSRIAEIYDQLAEILANTTQEKIALVAFRAMRNLNPRGALFIVKPRIIEDRSETIKLDQIADQVYRELDKGLPYSKIARTFGLTIAGCAGSSKSGTACPFIKDEHRRVWSRTQRRQANVLEKGRDAGHRRVLLRRPSVAE